MLDDASLAALDALIAEAGGPAWDEAGFARLRDHVAGRARRDDAQVVARVIAILDAARDVERRSTRSPRAGSSRRRGCDVAAQLGRLVLPGLRGGDGRRAAAGRRALPAGGGAAARAPARAPAPDRDRMRGVHELEALRRGRGAAAGRRPARCARSRWLLEELRVSHFAQALGRARAGVGEEDPRS